MQYRYGDSTDAPFDVDFLALSEAVIAYAVRVMLAAERIRDARADVSARMQSASDHVAQIEALGARLRTALACPTDGIEKPVDRVADAIAQAAHDEIGAGVARVKSRLADLTEGADQDIERERARCVLALSRLLATHDLPGCQATLRLELRDRGGYSVALRLVGPVDLDVDFDLDVPDDSLLCGPLRVRDVVGKLRVRVPAPRRWPRSGAKLVPRALDKLVVTEVVHSNARSTIALRDASGVAGYDVTVEPGADAVRIAAVGDDRANALPIHHADGADAEALMALHDELVGAAIPLAENRSRMVRAELGGTPISVLSDPEVPALRLIEWLAPTMREIAARSGSATELVIEVVYGRGTRRIVRERAVLRAAVEMLPEQLRGAFFALGLEAPPRKTRATPPPIPRDERSVDDGWRLPTAS